MTLELLPKDISVLLDTAFLYASAGIDATRLEEVVYRPDLVIFVERNMVAIQIIEIAQNFHTAESIRCSVERKLPGSVPGPVPPGAGRDSTLPARQGRCADACLGQRLITKALLDRR